MLLVWPVAVWTLYPLSPRHGKKGLRVCHCSRIWRSCLKNSYKCSTNWLSYCDMKVLRFLMILDYSNVKLWFCKSRTTSVATADSNRFLSVNCCLIVTSLELRSWTLSFEIKSLARLVVLLNADRVVTGRCVKRCQPVKRPLTLLQNLVSQKHAAIPSGRFLMT